MVCRYLGGARTRDIFLAVVKERHVLGFGVHQIANMEKRLGTRFSTANFMGQKELVKLTQYVRIALHKALCVHGIGITERAKCEVLLYFREFCCYLFLGWVHKAFQPSRHCSRVIETPKVSLKMCRVLGKVEPTDFLIFVGLIKGPVFVKKRCLDPRGAAQC